MLRCVLYIPPGPGFERLRDMGAAYAHLHHYDVVAVASTYESAIAMLAAGQVEVVVAGHRNHLPRVEVVGDQPEPPVVPPTQRRTRRRA